MEMSIRPGISDHKIRTMKTRKFVTIFSILSLLFLVLGLSSCTQPAHKKIDKPNIVFIMADDLGYGELGCYGQEKIHTPNIDALAKKGVMFTDFYSGSPVCAPARCMLMTGRHPGHAYIRGNNEMAGRGDVWDYKKASEDPNLEGQWPIQKGTVTLGRLMQNAGYKTACIGKWGLGGPLTEGNPTLQGFDLFFGYNCQRQAHNYYPEHLWRNNKKVHLDNEIVPPGTQLEAGADPLDPASYDKYTQKEYAPELMVREALNFISENKDHPFFLYYPTTIPRA